MIQTRRVLERLLATDLYRNATGDEQAELAGMFMKLQNQTGQSRWPGLLERVEAGTLASSDAVKTAIDGLLPNRPNGDPDYLQSGADNTLRGIAVLNALRGANADNPLARAWANVSADPLVGPVAAHRPNAANPHLGFEYDTVRSLFLTPEASRRFIAALDRGGALAEGNPQPQASGGRQAGFYVAGDDFVHWNRNGQGQAFIGGTWRSIDPDNLTRVRNGDGTTELMINENGRRATLLRVDPRSPGLRAEVTLAPGGIDNAMNVTFENPYLNRMLSALTAQDETGAKLVSQDFAGSAEGMAFIRRGEKLLAQEQAGEAQQQSGDHRQIGGFEQPCAEGPAQLNA